MSETFRDLIAWQTLEVQTQLEAAHKLGYLAEAAFEALIEKASEVSRLLNGLIKNLQKQIAADEHRSPKS